jgi:predicted RNA-binding protein YlqC (UPF0109 family)
MLLAVARMIVDKPDEVTVEITEMPQSVVYRLKVAPSDQDKVIGPGRRTERSLRNVLIAGGRKRSLNVVLDIVE